MTSKEAANYLGISLVTLHKYKTEGKIKSFRIGSKAIRFWRNDLIAFMNMLQTLRSSKA